MLLTQTAGAQQTPDPPEEKPAGIFVKTVGLQAGSQGIGAEAAVPLGRRFNLRAGVSILPLRGSQVRSFGNDLNYDASAGIDFQNYHAFADWQAFPRSVSLLNKLVVSLGGAYFYKGRADGRAVLANDYRYGDLILSPEDVGDVSARADWTGPAAYGGFGLTNLPVGKRFGFGVHLGVFYLGSPDVQVSGTGLLAANSSQEPVIRRNLKDYRWLPNLQFNFFIHY